MNEPTFAITQSTTKIISPTDIAPSFKWMRLCKMNPKNKFLWGMMLANEYFIFERDDQIVTAMSLICNISLRYTLKFDQTKKPFSLQQQQDSRERNKTEDWHFFVVLLRLQTQKFTLSLKQCLRLKRKLSRLVWAFHVSSSPRYERLFYFHFTLCIFIIFIFLDWNDYLHHWSCNCN